MLNYVITIFEIYSLSLSTSYLFADSVLSVSLSTVSSSLDSTITQKTTTSEIGPRKRKRDDDTLDFFVSKSTPAQKQMFDEQIARFIYATNTAFITVEHPEFIKMVQGFRPEYSPPSRKQIAGDLLEYTYRKEKETCANILKNEFVTLGLDGWSNIHNEPVICVTLTTKDGNTYLADTVDTQVPLILVKISMILLLKP